MKTKIISKAVLVFTLLLACVQFSCTGDYMNINTNPYQPQDDDMRGDNNDIGSFFSQMEMNVIPVDKDDYANAENMTGDIYSGYMALSNNFGPDNKTSSLYFFENDLLDAPFTETYANILGAWLKIKEKMDARTNGQAETTAIFQTAQILKIAGMSRLTDEWGPMPYTKAGQGGLRASYDAQDLIYNTFFNELDTAVDVLSDYIKNDSKGRPLKKFDVVYDGDFSKWIRFANSLRLRFAMRIVYADAAKAKTEAEKAVTNSFGLIDRNSYNATVKSGHKLIINNPLKYLWDEDGNCRAGANLVSVLQGYDDPRLNRYVQPSGFAEYPYLGLRTGIRLKDKEQYVGYSSPNIQQETPVVWMNAAEVWFLKAEGALHGWKGMGSARNDYEQGIATSFDQYGLSGAADYARNQTKIPADYRSPETSFKAVNKATIGWDEKATTEQNLERIITQKWIAIFPNGNEAWAEYRRTGYPRLFPVDVNNYNTQVSNTSVEQIARIPYPNTEYNLNEDNLQRGIAVLRSQSLTTNGPGDNAQTRLWWDKKNKAAL